MASSFLFGKIPISDCNIFFRSTYSIAIVNLKPVVPGLIPTKNVPRMAQLSAPELSDLWITAQRVGCFVNSIYTVTTTGTALEKHFKATALSFAVQDGKAAGQTVPHVHIHVMPRQGGDFKRNDDVYPAMDKNDKEWDERREPRSAKEMEEEAKLFSSLFVDQ